MSAENYKIYKGSVEQFKEWLTDLSEDITEAGMKKYEDIKNSVIYISEDFTKDPTELEHFDGAVFANGAIIKGANMIWNNDDVSIGPPF